MKGTNYAFNSICSIQEIRCFSAYSNEQTEPKGSLAVDIGCSAKSAKQSSQGWKDTTLLRLEGHTGNKQLLRGKTTLKRKRKASLFFEAVTSSGLLPHRTPVVLS